MARDNAPRENTMMRYRQDERLQKQARAAIVPFIPRAHRERLAYDLFMHCAAQQLEGLSFRAETLIPALGTFAAAGILPNKHLHHGYLIVYKGVVTPVFGYQGLIYLAQSARPANGAKLLGVKTDLIVDGDDYDPDAYEDDMVRGHRPRGARDPRVDPRKVLQYGYARFRYVIPLGAATHEYDVIEVLASGELAAVRSDRGDGWKSFPWRMYEKAAIRRACQRGNIPLAFGAGFALAAEMAGESGDRRAYQEAARVMAQATGAESEAFEDAIGAIEVSEGSAIDEYVIAADPFHEALRDPTCSLEDARNHMARLADMRQHFGVKTDETADTLFAAIEREYAKSE